MDRGTHTLRLVVLAGLLVSLLGPLQDAQGQTPAVAGRLAAAPAQPVLVSPADRATAISTSPVLQVTASDPDADALTISFYGRMVDASACSEFTLAAIPDAQNEVMFSPAMHYAQMQWLATEKSARNIVFVTGMGDMVNFPLSGQYSIANTAYNYLDAGNVAYSVGPGNHDLYDGGTLYESYFGVSRFSGKSWYGGHYGSNNQNNFSLFSASGMDFILINLQYNAGSAVLDWADGLLRTYATRRGIVEQHDILDYDNSWTNEAPYLALEDRPNLFLMLSGHNYAAGDGAAYRAELGDDGHTIHIVMQDYQEFSYGNGWLRLYRFSPATDVISMTTYSPYTGGSITTDPDQKILAYDMACGGAYSLIGTVTGAASGSIAAIEWPSLTATTEYEWYAVVSDGAKTTTGPIWQFTTGANLAVTATIPLTTGWNLLSLPLAPVSTAITQALFSITGSYNLVHAYNAFDSASQWKTYNPAAPAFLNGLNAINETMGLWVNATAPVTLTITGTQPISSSIPLTVGWNLVGYPSLVTRPVTVALTSCDARYNLVYAYDAFNAAEPWKHYDSEALASLNTLTEMGPGRGYWINTLEPCIWRLP